MDVLAAERLRVNVAGVVPVFPSVTLTLLMLMTGPAGSSLRIVPVPVDRVMVAPVGL